MHVLLILWSYRAQSKAFLTVMPTMFMHRYLQVFLAVSLEAIFALQWGCATGLEESSCRSPSTESGQGDCTPVWLALPLPKLSGCSMVGMRGIR